ncbi:hypothetical protein [Bradyrhizobium elkanii]|uniref:hypothetical protein n=1 Tax=Bradyrhizobium elkanii TaxID=29448 RepID=UPI0012FE491C|nr:hypothetical protein [Bradyrhizobium elkanii]WLA79534.1 hypothetical protein QNJ99_29555 [Bradyrhizobium elkanii]
MRTWHAVAFLIVTALALYYAKWPILIIAGLIGLFRGLYWLNGRYSRTMNVVMGFLFGMMRR